MCALVVLILTSDKVFNGIDIAWNNYVLSHNMLSGCLKACRTKEPANQLHFIMGAWLWMHENILLQNLMIDFQY